LGFADLIARHLTDSRKGKNTQLPPADLLLQSVYCRIAGDEDVNDAERLVLLYLEEPGLARPGAPESFGIGKTRKTSPNEAVRCIIDTGPERQNGNPGFLLSSVWAVVRAARK